MDALILIGLGFALIYVLWLFYLAVMNLKRANDAGTLTNTAYYLGLPILIVGYTLDVIANILPVSVLFLEFPRELVVTARLSRHISGEGWRSDLAKWFCRNLLDQFDPSGCHCK